MRVDVRDAVPSDDALLDVIARQGGASANAGYLALLRAQDARLLVAESRGRVVGFGGVVDVDGVAMLTDLFVAADARGCGVGTALLDQLFEGWSRRMTFSSKHPAALAAYRRSGLQPQWRLLYLDGSATGGRVAVPGATWQHDRRALVEELARQGAHVMADVVTVSEPNTTRIARLHSKRPVSALVDALAQMPVNTAVRMCVPEHSEVAAWSLANGFAIVDHDTFCATPGVALSPELHCLDPGLA
jgi:GNAT superfamily N-acetyltransferase